MSTVLTVAKMTLARAARRPSTYALAGLAMVPVLLAGVMAKAGYNAMGTAGPLTIRVIAPLLVVSLVASPVGESIEARTWVYYFIRPVSRALVVVGEALGFAILAAALMAACGGFLAVINAFSGNVDMMSLVRIPGAMALEAVGLVGFSMGLAVMFPKHPLFVPIGILTLTEGALASLGGRAQYVTLSWHVGQLAGIASDASDGAGGGVAAVSLVASLVALAVVALAPLGLSMRTVYDRDLT